MKQRLSVLLLLLALILSACAPAATPGAASTGLTLTDALGRTVSLPAAAKRVVAIGPGALRLYVYAGNLEYVVGVEEMETGDVSGKPYMLANPNLAKLPIIGLGGPNNAPDPEKLLTVTPDVIFSTYATDAAAADELQAQTGVPVVALSYGGFGVTPIFGQEIQTSLRLIGLATAQTEKAEKVITFLQNAQADLNRRTSNIPPEQQPSVYVGSLGAKGAHGIESTQAQYALLQAIHAHNVADETGKTGALMIDREKLLAWNPKIIFIDLFGYPTLQEDYLQNPNFYQALAAVQNGQVYSQLPYNSYSTNIDTAIADAYFLGKIIYPAAFADVDPAQKADEIYQALLGKSLYAVMEQKFGGFRALSLGE